MKFIIKRSKWLRGRGAFYSFLLNDKGMMCCFGFCALQCGVPETIINEVGYLDSLPSSARLLMEDFFSRLYPSPESDEDIAEKAWVKDAYGINDDKRIDDAEREKKLSALATANGHEFEFVD